MESRAEMRKEVRAVMSARDEVPGADDLFVDHLLDRLEQQIDTRVAAQLASKPGVRFNGKTASLWVASLIPVLLVVGMPAIIDPQNFIPNVFIAFVMAAIVAACTAYVVWNLAMSMRLRNERRR